MRVLHVAHMSVPAAGVIRQMEEEQVAADSLGLPWASRLFVPLDNASPVCVGSGATADNRINFKKAYYQWLYQESKNYQIILLRHSSFDPFQLFFLKQSKISILTVHHSLELPEIAGRLGFTSKFKAWAEWYFGTKSIKCSKGIVAVTNEIAQYEVARSRRLDLPIFIYPNGICYTENNTPPDLRSDKIPELLFVASHFASWHGLDLLLNALKESPEQLKLHLVGNLVDEQKSMALSDSRCVVHGLLAPDEIEMLAAKCWVGLSSFGLHRQKMREACTLKVREYLRLGLPVYSGHEDIFDSGMPYYKSGECNISHIVEFAKNMRSLSRQEVSQIARPYIDKLVLLQTLFNQLGERFY